MNRAARPPSLGRRSHLLSLGVDAQVGERDDCIVVRTPDNPTYYWGNFLLLPQAPRDRELAPWLRRFDNEIAALQPQSRHVAIGIDASQLLEPLPAWRDAGFDCDETAVLLLKPAALQPALRPANATVVLRALQLPGETALAVDLQCECNEDGFEPAGYRAFRQRSMARISALHAQGRACWFGAFIDGRLVADCGLVHDGHLGRFQHVETHPSYRRRGLCRALIDHVCRFGFDDLRLPQLVMCADPHDVAIGIYRAAGFAQVGSHWQLERRAPADAA